MTKTEFKDFFEQYFDEVRSYVLYRSNDQELATDITQDCFLKIWEKREKVNVSLAKGLAYKMASDLFINTFHHKKRTQQLFDNLSINQQDYSPEDLMLFEQLQDKYEALIENMPENQKVVFLMSRIDGLQYKEIAERLGLGIKAIEKRMGNALNYLRTALKED